MRRKEVVAKSLRIAELNLNDPRWIVVQALIAGLILSLRE